MKMETNLDGVIVMDKQLRDYRKKLVYCIMQLLQKNIHECGLGFRSSLPGLIHLKKTTMEIWRDVIGYEGHYQVSNIGNVKSLSRDDCRNQKLKERILKPNKVRGYLKVVLCLNAQMKTFRVHRLVAIAFIPNPENKPEVNHKWGNKLDNRAVALDWATRSENIRHSFRELGRKSSRFGKFGKDNHSSKPISQYSKCGKFIKYYSGQAEAVRITGVNKACISSACNRKQKTAGGYIWKFA